MRIRPIFGGTMEQNNKNRIVYAASYALLKRLVRKGVAKNSDFEKLNKVMAECQVCDLLISHRCKIGENP